MTHDRATRAAPAAQKLAALVLAAGGSQRLGRPKQLLLLEGEALVHRAARVALASGADETLVVTGAHGGAVAGALSDLAVRVVENPDWRDGIATSIRRGVAAAEARGCAAVLVVLADQPYVDGAILARIVRCFRGQGEALVACRYGDGALGAPALFAGRYRERLRELEGDRGAASLLKAHAEQVCALPFAPAAVDVDDEAGWRSVAHAKPGEV